MSLIDIDPKETIMRYMNFASFCGLLISKSLIFIRQDKFRDKDEGALPIGSVEIIKEYYKKFDFYTEKDTSKTASGLMNAFHGPTRSYIFANSWTINQVEDCYMWNNYLGGSKEGVAIQSTAGQLHNSLICPKGWTIKFGKIQYDTDSVPFENLDRDYVATSKLNNFIPEREYRAFIPRHGYHVVNDKGDPPPPLHDYKLDINVDLNLLINKIHVSASRDEWFYGVVRSIIQDYLPNFHTNNLIHSSLLF
jgi:hypothetical protein